MNKIIVAALLVFFAIPAFAQDLPGRHELKQNDKGEYYVVNKKDITMIEASILKLGYSSRWILACIKHVSVDTDLKRWVFIDIRTGGTFDTLHQENWEYFRDEAYPTLKEIKLTDYSDESCP
ncbi:MAG TPA: hypothetical protein EYQ42_09615 [Thiotrichaceae bacterium]|jgi:hypothetical protein|nr:hypothetical protein [Thiotrichaceae bacterium]HIM08518.1 hypothetical protein [Gammaproteobacteria bacterium]